MTCDAGLRIATQEVLPAINVDLYRFLNLLRKFQDSGGKLNLYHCFKNKI